MFYRNENNKQVAKKILITRDPNYTTDKVIIKDCLNACATHTIISPISNEPYQFSITKRIRHRFFDGEYNHTGYEIIDRILIIMPNGDMILTDSKGESVNDSISDYCFHQAADEIKNCIVNVKNSIFKPIKLTNIEELAFDADGTNHHKQHDANVKEVTYRLYIDKEGKISYQILEAIYNSYGSFNSSRQNISIDQIEHPDIVNFHKNNIEPILKNYEKTDDATHIMKI